jgi:hypothetical protein
MEVMVRKSHGAEVKAAVMARKSYGAEVMAHTRGLD